ncbi:hypothetical protein CWE09_03705 [Aliidiomarina minuta]|uniref:Toxin-antitoxin system YwqK family antitoxin n=1 Tax=Aliidiomarina minuta TaxID=880057 RepID=A0A432W7C0_9GAMM|nr:hypothetical protein [Aliidiomarina minuta]RUO25846.1 hypothetical protein CWE09_03705 [Aliidiomarina minuta]
MKVITGIWAVLCLSITPVATADTIWLNHDMERTVEADAVYVLDNWEEAEERGYQVEVNYLSGATYLETSIIRLNLDPMRFYGPYRAYYESGTLLKEGFRTLQGEWHGILTEYDEEGRKRQQTSYLNGELHGQQVSFFANGQVQQRQNYQHGRMVGEQWEWHANGQKKSYRLLNEDENEVVLRTYHVDGSLIQLKEPVESDYGPATLRQEYNAYGQLEEERIQSNNRRWRLFKGYGGNGEVQDRSEFLDRKREGWFVQTRWTGGVERVQYRAGQRHGTYERTNGQGDVVIAGQYESGNRVGEWVYVKEDEKVTESYSE